MRTVTLLLTALCVVALLATPLFAQEMMKIAGKMEATYVKQEPMEVGDTEEHMMTLGRSEGMNTSTGEHMFMDGAQIVNMSFADVVKGNGPHQGYVKFAMGDDVVYAKWQGTITTMMSDEGPPMMSFEGTFTYMGGMGQYVHIKGSGMYKGHFTSETVYMVEWEGEYAIMEE
jgi:hypothetical protein